MPTALITGASGYIAKHTVLRFLQAGYEVRGSVRRLERGAEVRAAVEPHVGPHVDLDRALDFVSLDLASDAGWHDAMEGVDVLVHIASPFPIEQPDDEHEIIRPAVDGTLRALRAAAANGVGRVVLTSSAVAMVGSDARHDGTFAEDDWSDPEHPSLNPYSKSKTLAERAAWDFVKNEAPHLLLTTINPAFVLGEPLDENYGSSMEVIERIVAGKDPAQPPVGFSVVDVGDIAEMHLRAAQRPETAGHRYAGSAGAMWFADMAKAIKEAHPHRKISTRTAPGWLLRILAVFDKQVRTILPSLHRIDHVDGSKASDHLDIEFTDPKSSVVSSANYIIANGLA